VEPLWFLSYKVYFWDVEIGEFDAKALRFRPVQFMRQVNELLHEEAYFLDHAPS
jgi:hypothetical protein